MFKTRRVSRTDIYHVMIRGINHEKVFGNDFYKHVIKGILYKKLEDKNVTIMAYCIMDTHLHLLIKASIEEMSLYMSRVENAYARFYNKSLGRNGHVFQNRYKSECVEVERYFYCCLKYIYKNPMKAGICKNIDEYEFSSLYEINRKKLFLLNEQIIKYVSLNEIDHVDDTSYLFSDVPEEIAMQKIAILKRILYKYMEIYDLHSIFQIYEKYTVLDQICCEYKELTKEGMNRVRCMVLQYILNEQCA